MKKKSLLSSSLASCLFFGAVFLSGLGACNAQQGNTQWVEPVQGIQIHPIFHASLELRWNGKTLLFDPSFDPALLSGVATPDIIFITDIHGDHLDTALLSRLEDKAIPIMAPQAVFDQLPDRLKRVTKVLSNGASDQWKGVGIEAMPMYNLPDAKQMFHPKGRGNGYVLELGGKRVYVSGDTEDTPEMRHLKNIDLAFVCMNLPYTMDVSRAARGVLAFKPKVVIPYHYREAKGLADIRQFKTLVAAGDKGIKVDLLDFYPGKH